MKPQGILKSVGQTIWLGEIPLGELWEGGQREGWSFRCKAKEFGLDFL